MVTRTAEQAGRDTVVRLVSFVAIVLAFALAHTLPRAQELPAQTGSAIASADGIDLAEVIRSTLAANADILLAAQRTEASRGAHLEAAAPFDPLLSASTGVARPYTVDPVTGSTTQLSTAGGVRRLFRNGLYLSADIELLRTDPSTVGADGTANDAATSVSLGAPLLRDRGGAVSAAPERAARHRYDAARADQHQALAARLLIAVAAYWDYLAAQRRLQVFVEAEERARQTVDQTGALVKADERTSADLTQMQGNLAAKRAIRFAAEQAVVEAWEPLVVAMGLPPEAIVTQLPAVTGFPALSDTAAARLTAARLLEEAYARRPDLTAAEQNARAAQTLLDASASELDPRLDLIVGTGYRARTLGSAFTRYFEPLGPRAGDGLDASVRLAYEFATRNSAARGRQAQNAAAVAQQRIVHTDLRRRIAAGVAVADAAYTRGELGMRESAEAVRLLELTVQAEQRKFGLGMATLFDVINAQDALTNALLGLIGSQRNYAVAIASLRYQSGTLVTLDGPSAPGQPAGPRPGVPLVPLVPPQTLLTPP